MNPLRKAFALCLAASIPASSQAAAVEAAAARASAAPAFAHLPAVRAADLLAPPALLPLSAPGSSVSLPISAVPRAAQASPRARARKAPERAEGSRSRIKGPAGTDFSWRFSDETSDSPEGVVRRARVIDSILSRMEGDDNGAQAWDGGPARGQSAPAAALPGNGERAPRPDLSKAPRLKSSVPAFLAGAAGVFGLDSLARSLLPALFGFSLKAGLWTTLGMGCVLVPALLWTRRKVASMGSPAVSPVLRRADFLLGGWAGSAAATALGYLTRQASTAVPGSGLLSLSAILGLAALVASMPVIYGGESAARGLIEGRRVGIKFSTVVPLFWSIPLMFDVLALPGIALGTILFGNLGMWDILPWGLTLATYFLSRNQLSGLTSRGKRAPLDPEAWRVDGLGRGPRLEAGRELKRTQLAAALNFAAAALLALALKSLYLGSVSAAAAGIWAGLPGLLKTFAIAVSAGWLLQRGLLTLFLKADRVRDGAFHRMVLSLARRAGIPEPAVFSGKNSPIGANAFAMGFLHHGASVTELHPILDLLTPEEAEAVMAHEVSHIRYRHLLYLIGSLSLFGMVGSGLGTTLMQMTIRCWLPVASALVLFALMRNDETMADTGAALLTGAPSALASGLRKLMLYISIHSGARQDGWVHRIFLSHPDPLIRIDRLLRMDADAPRGGPLPARHG